MRKTIIGRDIEPGCKVVIRGNEQVVESVYESSNGKFWHLRLTSGLAWPVQENERLILVGMADNFDLTGVPENEL